MVSQVAEWEFDANNGTSSYTAVGKMQKRVI